jgi:hypothetical protein
MPETAKLVAPDLVEYLTDILQPLFDEKRAIVWYDHEGSLEEPLRAAASQRGWTMVPGPGAKNPLAARVEIEEHFQTDGYQWLADRKWLAYVADNRQDPSWYDDLELVGRAVHKTLADVIAERHRLPIPKVASLVKDHVARRLVDRWEEVFPNGTWNLTLDILGAALLALSFGEHGPLSPRTAVIRFLRDPAQSAAILQAEGLTSTFIQIIRAQLGFGRLPESDELKPAMLVRAMMASELVHKGACEASPAINNYLPQKNHIPIWAEMAETAAKEAENQLSFLPLARDVEGEVQLVQHVTDLQALSTVASLPTVDDRLLEEAVVRCQAPEWRKPTNLTELRQWADERLKLRDLGVKVASDWSVVADATRLVLGCDAAEKELAALPEPSADDLISRYAEKSGWWTLDDLDRGLELRFESCREDLAECLGKPAVQALWKLSQSVAQSFAEALDRSGTYGASTLNIMPHCRFWSEMVETGDLGETAILFVDALRFDLAEKLIRLVSQAHTTVTSRLALASLPSKTPVGMASLLPRSGLPLVVLAKNGKLRAEIGDRDVSDLGSRVEHLRQTISNIEVAELKGVTESQLRHWAVARRPLVLTTRDIDDSGEIAANVAPNLFEDLVADLARWVTVLHRVGYRRVVIGTDHGFLLVPLAASFEELPGPRKDGDTTFSTRYAVGSLEAGSNCLNFDPSDLGRGGTARVVLPKGLAAFSTAGPRHRFVHGGLSLQECLLRFVTSTEAGPPKAPVLVKLARLVNITSLIIYLQVEVTTPSVVSQSRRVRVEARTGERPIGRSDVFMYKPQQELGSNESYPRIKLVITESVALTDLFLVDEDSGDVLDFQLGVPNVMRHEAEEDLL